MASNDPRTHLQQVASGFQLGATTVGVLMAAALFYAGQFRILHSGEARTVAAGCLMVGVVAIALALTVRYWSRWFFGILCVAVLRVLLGPLWYALGNQGLSFLWSITILALLVAMAILSYRFTENISLSVLDRVSLCLATLCLFGVLGADKPLALALISTADLSLLISWT